MIADEVNMNRETFRLILTEEFVMIKTCAKMVPKNLREQQRDARLSAVFDIQMLYSDSAVSLLTLSRTLRLLFIEKIKTALKGQHFESTEHIQMSVTQDINDIPQNAFQQCCNGNTAGNDVCRHKGLHIKY
jgi:hypothetical protein